MDDEVSGAPDDRRADLSRRRASLLQRVARAAAAAGRQPQELTVITVTKTFPASDVALLHAMGVLDIGENRAQELASKISELEGVLPPPPAAAAIRWHFVGQLQSNKASLVGRECFALHTLDREVLLAPLDRAATLAGRRLDVFIQLSLDGDPRRGGIVEDGIGPLADAVATHSGLRLAGLMAVPPLGVEPRPAFARLRSAGDRLRISHPGATAISAGMSADLEDAVIEGATHLRVGTDLMGSRA